MTIRTALISLLALTLTGCGDLGSVPSDPQLGYCYHLSTNDEGGYITIFRPCETESENTCITRILGGQETHSFDELTDCRACLAGEVTLSGIGAEFTVPTEDLDYVCSRYDSEAK